MFHNALESEHVVVVSWAASAAAEEKESSRIVSKPCRSFARRTYWRLCSRFECTRLYVCGSRSASWVNWNNGTNLWANGSTLEGFRKAMFDMHVLGKWTQQRSSHFADIWRGRSHQFWMKWLVVSLFLLYSNELTLTNSRYLFSFHFSSSSIYFIYW